MHEEQKVLEKKNNDHANKISEKNKQHTTLHRLYNSLKQQQLAAGLELAAGHDAEHVLQTNRQDGHHRNDLPMQSRSGSNGSGNSSRRSRTIHAWENQMGASRAGLQAARKLLTLLQDGHVLMEHRHCARASNAILPP